MNMSINACEVYMCENVYIYNPVQFKSNNTLHIKITTPCPCR